jgi:hypothetical protein
VPLVGPLLRRRHIRLVLQLPLFALVLVLVLLAGLWVYGMVRYRGRRRAADRKEEASGAA